MNELIKLYFVNKLNYKIQRFPEKRKNKELKITYTGNVCVSYPFYADPESTSFANLLTIDLTSLFKISEILALGIDFDEFQHRFKSRIGECRKEYEFVINEFQSQKHNFTHIFETLIEIYSRIGHEAFLTRLFKNRLVQ